MARGRKKTEESELADISVERVGPERLAKIDAFLRDKQSPFSRIVPARTAVEAPPRVIRRLPW